MLVGIPEEAYSVLQQDLRRRFPETSIVCVTLVNNRIGGYLPPQQLFTQDIYQIWRTPFAAGSLEIVIAALTQSIEQIMAGKPHLDPKSDPHNKMPLFNSKFYELLVGLALCGKSFGATAQARNGSLAEAICRKGNCR